MKSLKIRDLPRDERCTRPILGFPHTTGVGSRVGLGAVPPKPEDDGAEGLASERGAEDGELEGEKAMNEGWGLGEESLFFVSLCLAGRFSGFSYSLFGGQGEFP